MRRGKERTHSRGGKQPEKNLGGQTEGKLRRDREEEHPELVLKI